LAVILFLEGNVPFLDLLDLDDQTSRTIAGHVAPLIRQLALNNIIVTVVCTDNATNEKAILNWERAYQYFGFPAWHTRQISRSMTF
jgi:hypothetical protein